MANPRHVAIMEKGLKAWNEWREAEPKIEPDLSGVNFSLPPIGGTDSNAASLSAPDVRSGVDANLIEANLSRVNLSNAYLGEANLIRANLYKAILQGADVSKADLRRSSLVGADLRGAILDRTQMENADLTHANLGEAVLTLAFLRDANLEAADMKGANLTGADLFGANLFGANLIGTDLRRVVPQNANFTNARVGWTVFGDNDLSAVKGLETVVHFGPSSIGIDTIYKSKGNIPEVFLRGAGVPEDFIIYMKSLVGKAIDFYSCFISYSSKDDDFAQRLHADLQQKGVRCWFAPKDLKIGDEFRTRIDESIRIYDKLMVILSANSIRSPWVEEEVEAAIEKEHKQNKLVLFPIRLDDAVMETDHAWAASLRRTRHIGDFRAWKDHDPYQNSFERLLRDLKA